MSKLIKPKSRTKKPQTFNPQRQLECRHYQERSIIVTYSDALDKWKEVAEIRPVAGLKHEVIAKYICELINENLSHQSILHDAMDALELCLTEATMTFSTEQAADCVLTRIHRVAI
jgi:hypothetical protein